mmetsp:Transcript_147185/g.382600  ORF Transcript_147185/g.382600 Transcript_147185/m.382600 type:complete len:261 (+) Transcript_147185:470-1252(+)
MHLLSHHPRRRNYFSLACRCAPSMARLSLMPPSSPSAWVPRLSQSSTSTMAVRQRCQRRTCCHLGRLILSCPILLHQEPSLMTPPLPRQPLRINRSPRRRRLTRRSRPTRINWPPWMARWQLTRTAVGVPAQVTAVGALPPVMAVGIPLLLVITVGGPPAVAVGAPLPRAGLMTGERLPSGTLRKRRRRRRSLRRVPPSILAGRLLPFSWITAVTAPVCWRASSRECSWWRRSQARLAYGRKAGTRGPLRSRGRNSCCVV